MSRLHYVLTLAAISMPFGPFSNRSISEETSATIKRSDAPNVTIQNADRLFAESVGLLQQGKASQAVDRLQQVLAIREGLYPIARYPEGHPDLAQIFKALGIAAQTQGETRDAEAWFDKALQMDRRLYPVNRFPNGNLKIALALGRLGYVLQANGKFQESQAQLEESLNMLLRLFPTEQYPRGNEPIAQALQYLGGLMAAKGDFARAAHFHHRAVEVLDRLYPADKYPQGNARLAQGYQFFGIAANLAGDIKSARASLEKSLSMLRQIHRDPFLRKEHTDIASVLTALGGICQSEAKYAEAMGHFEEALKMLRRLFPESAFPDGQSNIASTLTSLGQTAHSRGDIARASECLSEALAIYERLYPADQHPASRPEVASTAQALAFVLRDEGEFAAAIPYAKRALEIFQGHYGTSNFPNGHPDVVTSLIQVGGLLAEEGDAQHAMSLLKQVLVLGQKIYTHDQYPQGHDQLASCLDYLGSIHLRMAHYAPARDYLEQALNMRRNLHPGVSHLSIAASLEHVAAFYANIGELGRSRDLAEQAVAMQQSLYPEQEYPSGHPLLAKGLDGLATIFAMQGDPNRAESCLRRAIAMDEKLCRSRGAGNVWPYAVIADHLDHLARVLTSQGKYSEAEQYYIRALDIRRLLFPGSKYRNGHVSVGESLGNLSCLMAARGDYEAALKYSEQATAMFENRYPASDYPIGHPQLAIAFSNHGTALWLHGDSGAAADALLRSTRIWEALTGAFGATASQVETMGFSSAAPPVLGLLISLWPNTMRPANDLYSEVWCCHGAVGRVVTDRHRRLALAGDAIPADDPRIAAYVDAQRELARLVLARVTLNADQAEARRNRINELTTQKEDLERNLAGLARYQALGPPSYTHLMEEIPSDSVFVDLCRYALCENDPEKPGKEGMRITKSYVAFTLARGRGIEIVELGPAAPIETAVREWRQAIDDDKATGAAQVLRRLVWEPIQKRLPADAATIYLAPDGALTSIPWNALPGKAAGSVLLEEYAIALVPYGPFLLDRLTAQQRDRGADDVLFAVGGVSYDEQPTVPTDAAKLAALRGDAAIEGRGVRWNDLPGTRDEIDGLLAIAGDRQNVSLIGRQASTARVIAELPKARWAIFATHGFFADAKLRSAMQLDESIFTRQDLPFSMERTTPVGRNPLLLSGLVFAGANLPLPEDQFGIRQGDGGIVTAEAIAGLPLDKLELVVLSACDTGLGEVAAGEGVFGLQRAFHQAGAANVVASLWRIDDRATAALMRLFYYKLFRESKSPIVALRESQLAIYHHPERIAQLASARAPEFGETAKLVDGGKVANANDRAATRLWARFVLSGTGR